jgi:hypothetical protein
MPDTNLRIQFDDMEMYLELNTVLEVGATYEINLYSLVSPISIKVGQMLQFGVMAVVDLILLVQTPGKVDISSGFHIKVEDGVVFDIAMFGDKASNMIL